MNATVEPSRLSRAIHAPMSRADHLVLRVLLALVALGAATSAVVALWPGDTIAFTAAVDGRGPAYTPAGSATDASATYASEVVWTLTEPSLGDRVLVGLPTVFAAVCVILGVLLLLGIVSNIRRDQAFSRQTLSRVRWLALLVVFGGLLQPFVAMAVSFAMAARVQAEPSVLFTFSLVEFAPVLVGMLLLVLGEALTRGAALADDVEGLV